jgi:methylase of polypeptide subunit release factors
MQQTSAQRPCSASSKTATIRCYANPINNGYSGGNNNNAFTTTVILTEDQSSMTEKGAALFDVVADVAQSGGSTSYVVGPSTTIPGQVFVCPEESLFYSQCLEKMVFSRPDCPSTMIEFGAGDGSPVISALLKSPPHLGKRVIHAYEISPRAASVAAGSAARCGLEESYVVHNSCFWKGTKETPADCLVSNPPYLPAPDGDIMMPELWGGLDGAELTRDLLSAGFNSTMLMISAYSNPIQTLEHARDQGYAVTDFLITPLPFGTYSSEPKVRAWIAGMKEKGQAFYSSRMYFLAGVLFEKKTITGEKPDLYNELLKVLTAF